MLHDAEVAELPQREGLETVTAEWLTVEDHPARAKDHSAQSGGGGIQDDEIDLVGAEVLREDPEDLEPDVHGVRRLVEIDGRVHVAQGAQVPRRRAPEQIGEDDVRAGLECVAECREPFLDALGERLPTDHVPHYSERRREAVRLPRTWRF